MSKHGLGNQATYNSRFMETGLKGRVAIVAASSQEEVADTIVWLASESASYITGQAIMVDGGACKGS